MRRGVPRCTGAAAVRGIADSGVAPPDDLAGRLRSRQAPEIESAEGAEREATPRADQRLDQTGDQDLAARG